LHCFILSISLFRVRPLPSPDRNIAFSFCGFPPKLVSFVTLLSFLSLAPYLPVLSRTFFCPRLIDYFSPPFNAGLYLKRQFSSYSCLGCRSFLFSLPRHNRAYDPFFPYSPPPPHFPFPPVFGGYFLPPSAFPLFCFYPLLTLTSLFFNRLLFLRDGFSKIDIPCTMYATQFVFCFFSTPDNIVSFS